MLAQEIEKKKRKKKDERHKGISYRESEKMLVLAASDLQGHTVCCQQILLFIMFIAINTKEPLYRNFGHTAQGAAQALRVWRDKGTWVPPAAATAKMLQIHSRM